MNQLPQSIDVDIPILADFYCTFRLTRALFFDKQWPSWLGILLGVLLGTIWSPIKFVGDILAWGYRKFSFTLEKCGFLLLASWEKLLRKYCNTENPYNNTLFAEFINTPLKLYIRNNFFLNSLRVSFVVSIIVTSPLSLILFIISWPFGQSSSTERLRAFLGGHYFMLALFVFIPLIIISAGLSLSHLVLDKMSCWWLMQTEQFAEQAGLCFTKEKDDLWVFGWRMRHRIPGDKNSDNRNNVQAVDGSADKKEMSMTLAEKHQCTFNVVVAVQTCKATWLNDDIKGVFLEFVTGIKSTEITKIINRLPKNISCENQPNKREWVKYKKASYKQIGLSVYGADGYYLLKFLAALQKHEDYYKKKFQEDTKIARKKCIKTMEEFEWNLYRKHGANTFYITLKNANRATYKQKIKTRIPNLLSFWRIFLCNYSLERMDQRNQKNLKALSTITQSTEILNVSPERLIK